MSLDMCPIKRRQTKKCLSSGIPRFQPWEDVNVRSICHDKQQLSIPARPARKADRAIAQDLLDTLKAHQDSCVGMAANMIGEPVSIIAVNENGKFVIMYDPHIIRFALPYETQESCLSVAGTHSCIRYDLIEVEYRDFRFIKKKKKFSGLAAQIIQHEIDHLHGILI